MKQAEFDDVRTALFEHVTRPGFEPLTALAARRRTRRRAGAVGAVAVVVVFAVLASTWVTLGGSFLPRPAVPAAAEPVPPDPASRPPFDPQPVTGPIAAEHPTAVPAPVVTCKYLPVDARRIYLVLKSRDCDKPSAMMLAHTTDGGRSWQTWLVPGSLFKTDGSDYDSAILLDGLSVAIGRMLTRDGGRTWHDVPVDRVAAVDSIPVGWLAVAMQDADSLAGIVVAVDPATGQRHPLVHRPRLAVGAAPGTVFLPAADGSLWVPGTAEGIGGGVAVSRDQGHSWTVRMISDHVSSFSSVTSSNGRVGYVVSPAEQADHAVSELFKTVDGGQTWTPQPAPRGSFVVLLRADGALLMLAQGASKTEGQLLVSTDNGQHFGPLPDAPKMTWLERTFFGGYLAGQVGATAAFSADGVHFQPIPKVTK
jgi:photosystem II stability/assembly factor-like uncharacterized protein